jgi:hypothetical protein
MGMIRRIMRTRRLSLTSSSPPDISSIFTPVRIRKPPKT